MRRYLWVLLLAAVAGTIAACSQGHEAGEGSAASAGAVRPAKGPPADNSRCHLCHADRQDEVLAASHAKVGVGCAACHGASDEHCGDADSVIPPDIIVAKADIQSACVKCHTRLTREHDPVLAGTVKRSCTDCHGRHRLVHRTRQWDKKTGALLPENPQG